MTAQSRSVIGFSFQTQCHSLTRDHATQALLTHLSTTDVQYFCTHLNDGQNVIKICAVIHFFYEYYYT